MSRFSLSFLVKVSAAPQAKGSLIHQQWVRKTVQRLPHRSNPAWFASVAICCQSRQRRQINRPELVGIRLKQQTNLRQPRCQGGSQTGLNECSWNFPLGPRAQCQLHALQRNSILYAFVRRCCGCCQILPPNGRKSPGSSRYRTEISPSSLSAWVCWDAGICQRPACHPTRRQTHRPSAPSLLPRALIKSQKQQKSTASHCAFVRRCCGCCQLLPPNGRKYPRSTWHRTEISPSSLSAWVCWDAGICQRPACHPTRRTTHRPSAPSLLPRALIN